MRRTRRRCIDCGYARLEVTRGPKYDDDLWFWIFSCYACRTTFCNIVGTPLQWARASYFIERIAGSLLAPSMS